MTSGERYCFAEFVLDPGERVLESGGRHSQVQPRTFALLVYLVRNPDRLISRDELFEAVWPEQVVSDSALAQAVREVRKLLGDDASQPRFLETVPRGGYRFLGPVEHRTAAAAAGGSGRRWALLGAIAMAFALLAWLQFAGREDGPAGGTESPSGDPKATDVAALNAQRFYHLALEQFGRRTGGAQRQAEAHFLRALELDPRHAGAMAGVAILRMLAADSPEGRDQALAEARPMRERALEIDPDNGLAHAAQGLALMESRAYEAAEAHLLRATKLSPELADPYLWLGTLYAGRGRLADAMTSQREALLRSPAHSSAAGNLAMNLIKAGRDEEAEELILSQAELPDAWAAMVYFRAYLASHRGASAEVLRIYLEAVERVPGSSFFAASIARGLAEIGLPQLGDAWADRALEACAPRVLAAVSFLRMADRWEEAGQLLDRTLAENDLTVARAAENLRIELAIQAIRDGDFSSGIEFLRDVYPVPGRVDGWRGEFTVPADRAHFLAYALRRVGREGEALPYLAQIQAEIDLRWQNGFVGYAPLTVTEARNELLLGNPAQAIALLDRAVDEGFRGLAVLRSDPRWKLLDGRPDYERVQARIETRLAAARRELEEDGTLDRLAVGASHLPPVDCAGR